MLNETPTIDHDRISPARPAWRWLFPILWIGVLAAPGWVFFTERDGLSFFSGRTGASLATAIFPLFGLYALTLVWTQVILGSLMPLWQRLFPRVFIFHRAEGVVALLFATTHPLLLAFGVGLESYFARDFVSSSQEKFLFFGYTAFFTIYLTVTTALLMRKKLVSRWWRKIHVLNYVVFAAAWLHSWNLGSDVQSTGLHYLWWWFGLSVIVAIFLRIMKVGRYSADAI